jgi:hypothetical protein
MCVVVVVVVVSHNFPLLLERQVVSHQVHDSCCLRRIVLGFPAMYVMSCHVIADTPTDPTDHYTYKCCENYVVVVVVVVVVVAVEVVELRWLIINPSVTVE